jgi:hypothetical protein
LELEGTAKMPFEDKDEFKIRSLLREYEALLKEFAQLVQSSERQSEQISTLQGRLLQQKAEIEGLQANRRIKFVPRFSVFGLGMNIRDLGPSGALSALRRWRRDIRELPTSVGGEFFDTPFFEERRYLEDAIIETEEMLRQYGHQVPGSDLHQQDDATKIANHVVSKVEEIAKMNQQCEDLIKQHPEQEKIIREMYRKIIDTIRMQL